MIEVPALPAVTLGIVVFFLGAFLTRNVRFLQEFSIPEPVSGGLVVALATWLVYATLDIKITFDLAARDEFLVIFFATVGLNARVKDLGKGGFLLATLLMIAIFLMVVQNCIGVLGAFLFDLPTPVAVLIGSASLIGGHGTSIAETTGFAAAPEIGIASATLGLVAAALLGGPIAKLLIERNGLEGGSERVLTVGLPHPDEESDGPEPRINHISIMRVLLWTNVAVMLGYLLDESLQTFGIKLPLFVSCLFVGIALSNLVPLIFRKIHFPSRTRAMAIVSDYTLSIFLAMSLMSMQLWTLEGLGGPLLFVLVLQVGAVVLLTVFLFFRLLGRDYTAAVLCAGLAGFTLGATPTAMANMSSVTKFYGPAPLAFIVLPLVSAFFIDIANAVVIKLFLLL